MDIPNPVMSKNKGNQYLMIYQCLHIGVATASRNEKYLDHMSFGIYFAWINVATVANVTGLFIDSGWGCSVLSDLLKTQS
jgi:hypothetical protein